MFHGTAVTNKTEGVASNRERCSLHALEAEDQDVARAMSPVMPLEDQVSHSCLLASGHCPESSAVSGL